MLESAIKEVSGKHVLVCPLNWGLGHATRCVPIIKALKKSGKHVIIGAYGSSLEFLKIEFPEIQTIYFPSINPHYSKQSSQTTSILSQTLNFCICIFKEHIKLKKIIRKHHIESVISDNRFGLWSKHAQSIYITHQLMIKMPSSLKWMEKTIWRTHRFFISKYDFCWIPDLSTEDNLSGDLSHKYPLLPNTRFIGPLSRFTPIAEKTASPYKTLAIISGLEPQRTILEQKLIALLLKQEEPSILVQGIPSATRQKKQVKQLTIISSASSDELNKLISGTPHIVCRSGYSSLMDLSALNKTATLIPTPGQTEQEYLAEYAKKRGFLVVKQDFITPEEFYFCFNLKKNKNHLQD